MVERIIVGIGAGRCGLASLAKLFESQPSTRVSCHQPPRLEWLTSDGSPELANARLRRLERGCRESVLVDIAATHLPYLTTTVGRDERVKVVCLRRPTDEIVRSFELWCDSTPPYRVDQWSERHRAGFCRDPFTLRLFPRNSEDSRSAALRRYVDEYYSDAERLARDFPTRVAVFDTADVLEDIDAQRRLLRFCGYSAAECVPRPGLRERAATATPPGKARFSDHPLDPRRCVVIVPFNTTIVRKCEESLVELERRGYAVWRVEGFAAIDQGRNQLASDALRAGYAETMWIDSDVAFHPDCVEQLRSAELPVICGIYPQKGRRSFACYLLPGTSQLEFGRGGGVSEIRYAAGGFLLVRREVYLTIIEQLRLPVCNERFGHPIFPLFQPETIRDEDGYWYLAEDYAFSERIRRCGISIMADTRLRLWHVGSYNYSWEDACRPVSRFDSFTAHMPVAGASDAEKASPDARPWGGRET